LTEGRRQSATDDDNGLRAQETRQSSVGIWRTRHAWCMDSDSHLHSLPRPPCGDTQAGTHTHTHLHTLLLISENAASAASALPFSREDANFTASEGQMTEPRHDTYPTWDSIRSSSLAPETEHKPSIKPEVINHANELNCMRGDTSKTPMMTHLGATLTK
jgi:hypothetical protein